MSQEEFTYNCVSSNENALTCAETCVTVFDCDTCQCAVLPVDGGGPWGEVVDVLFSLLPIAFLIFVTIKKKPWPTTLSLPASAAVLAVIRLTYFASDPLLVSSAIVRGLHEALTPLSIMAGAITLFETMEATACLPYMMREMKALTASHPVSELMLMFAFCYTVEGASGFGTPVALGAPMLVSSGHAAKESVVVLLLFNTFATVWGAVGTPLWFGFGTLDLTDDQLLDISFKAAVALCVSAFLLIPFILTILVPRAVVRQNVGFVYAALVVTIGPSVGLAYVNYEFPSLIGGLLGTGLTAFLIKRKVFLRAIPENTTSSSKEEQERPTTGNGNDNADGSDNKNSNNVEEEEEEESPTVTPVGAMMGGVEEGEDGDGVNVSIEETELFDAADTNGEDLQPPPQQPPPLESFADLHFMEGEMSPALLMEDEDNALPPRKTGAGYYTELLMRTFPIWGVVLILIITRIEPIGIKEYLIKPTPYFSIHFGTWGTFRLSASLVFQLNNILTYPNSNWKYELLYVPFLIPFVLVSLLTMVVYRKDLTCRPRDVAVTVAGRLKAPAIALAGALILVQLMIRTGTAAPAFILGTVLADWFQEGFVVISPLLGALGSFFSGSTTVSNLTFGEIQRIAAESVGTSATSMLALQACGASAGNGICLNNIISACTVVGLTIGEGQILLQTYKYVFLSTTVATVVMLAFFFRFNG